jgi:hypothetical protein
MSTPISPSRNRRSPAPNRRTSDSGATGGLGEVGDHGPIAALGRDGEHSGDDGCMLGVAEGGGWRRGERCGCGRCCAVRSPGAPRSPRSAGRRGRGAPTFTPSSGDPVASRQPPRRSVARCGENLRLDGRRDGPATPAWQHAIMGREGSGEVVRVPGSHPPPGFGCFAAARPAAISGASSAAMCRRRQRWNDAASQKWCGCVRHSRHSGSAAIGRAFRL